MNDDLYKEMLQAKSHLQKAINNLEKQLKPDVQIDKMGSNNFDLDTVANQFDVLESLRLSLVELQYAIDSCPK